MSRGPLPPSVYWRRRLFVLGTVAALVMVLVGLVRGADTPEPEQAASLQAADAGDEAGAGDPGDPFTLPDSVGESGTATKGRRNKNRQQSSSVQAGPPLATPAGQCDDTDVLVSPAVAGAVAGRDVTISLSLRTATAAACTWRVSANHLALKITDGDDEVWASRECPKLVPTRSVVVRKDVTSSISLTWNSRRSEEGCPGATDYAQAGDYTVAAAAIGGEPGESSFELSSPSPAVITVPTPGQGNQGQGGNTSKSKNRNGTGAAISPDLATR